jgi:succinate dehydrogenase / fumarate reductase cytochrome b subunit
MARNPDRPLSPHLTVWKWGPHMLVSILHRITGAGLATVGAAIFVWWLVAVAGSAETYATFAGWATWKWSLIVWVGLTWAFFQHTLSGLRHLVLDMGAGFELRANKMWSNAVLAGAMVLTILFWALLWWMVK